MNIKLETDWSMIIGALRGEDFRDTARKELIAHIKPVVTSMTCELSIMTEICVGRIHVVDGSNIMEEIVIKEGREGCFSIGFAGSG